MKRLYGRTAVTKCNICNKLISQKNLRLSDALLSHSNESIDFCQECSNEHHIITLQQLLIKHGYSIPVDCMIHEGFVAIKKDQHNAFARKLNSLLEDTENE